MKKLLLVILGIAALSEGDVVFSTSQLLFEKPVAYGSPSVVDWDNDGLNDILFGEADSGYVWFYKNTGTKIAPKFEENGKLQADGGDLITLHSS